MAKKVITIIFHVVLVILIIAGVVFESLCCLGDRIIIGKTKTEEFTAADDDFVHSYKVVVDGNEEKFFFSDYYNGIGNMSKTVELMLKSDGQKHNYKIYALDSWGAQSKDCIEIDA